MTDLELLNLAAKAAGYWDAEYNTWDGRPNLAWNPLTDDGDALRLAVQLKFAINVWGGCWVMTGGGLDETCVMENISTDPCAATRRAIVRAAAAIGSTKP